MANTSSTLLLLGETLGVRGAGFVMFWDWECGEIVRQIDIEVKNVSFFWLFFCLRRSESTVCLDFLGSLVVITAEDPFYNLQGEEINDDGVKQVFETHQLIADMSEW